MSDTGYNWDAAWTFVQKSGGGDWDDLAQADTGYAYSAAMSLDGKAACIIGIELDEDAAGAPDANGLDIYVLGHSGEAHEEYTIGVPFTFNVLAVQSDVVHLQFSVDPKYYDDFVIGIYNDCGVAIDTTVRVKYATIPAATA